MLFMVFVEIVYIFYVRFFKIDNKQRKYADVVDNNFSSITPPQHQLKLTSYWNNKATELDNLSMESLFVMGNGSVVNYHNRKEQELSKPKLTSI